jgi:hypothetical protein
MVGEMAASCRLISLESVFEDNYNVQITAGDGAAIGIASNQVVAANAVSTTVGLN